MPRMLYRRKRRPHRHAVEVLWELEPGAGLEHFAWADGRDADRAAIVAQLEVDAPEGTRIGVVDDGPRRWRIDIVEPPEADYPKYRNPCAARKCPP